MKQYIITQKSKYCKRKIRLNYNTRYHTIKICANNSPMDNRSIIYNRPIDIKCIMPTIYHIYDNNLMDKFIEHLCKIGNGEIKAITADIEEFPEIVASSKHLWMRVMRLMGLYMDDFIDFVNSTSPYIINKSDTYIRDIILTPLVETAILYATHLKDSDYYNCYFD